jgi:hypothetical protein
MRIARVLQLGALAILVSGCLAPDDTSTTNPLLGRCPQWLAGPGQMLGNLTFATTTAAADNQTFLISPPTNSSTSYRGRPLDIYQLNLTRLDVHGGRLELRAYSKIGDVEERRLIRDLRVPNDRGDQDRWFPALLFTPGTGAQGAVFEVALTSLLQSDAPAPAPLSLHWSFVPDGPTPAGASVSFAATFQYKVCGIAG